LEREGRCSTVEKEGLAIRWAVDPLRYYLQGRSFTLWSDHAPLQWLHGIKIPTPGSIGGSWLDSLFISR